MNTAEIVALNDRYLFPTYARAPLALVRGQGSRVWDADGREYLDFFSSTVVTSLGHAHPKVTKAITEQAGKILHVSNLHHSEPQALLARLLCEHSFADRVFLCNSGAEANEAAIKLARRYGSDRGGGRFEILTATGSFHGRTMATIAATGQEKVRRGFQPVPEGFRYFPFDDIEALRAAISARTVGVLIEPIQGEAGVITPDPSYLRSVREVCDEHGVLLILDEIQTGMGRTGTLFAYEQSGAQPDIMTLAKGLGAGVPIGAMLASQDIAKSFDAGSHGSTFGGNALTCAAATAVFDAMLHDGVLENCCKQGAYLVDRVRRLGAGVKSVRGAGLLLGVEVDRPGATVVEACRGAGLLINSTGGSILRLSPPLIVTAAEVDEAVGILESVLKK